MMGLFWREEEEEEKEERERVGAIHSFFVLLREAGANRFAILQREGTIKTEPNQVHVPLP